MSEAQSTQSVCFFDGPSGGGESNTEDCAIISANGVECKSAGIIPFNNEGIWLGRMANGGALVDFGGVGQSHETAWTTASRACREECGLIFEAPMLDPATHSGKKHISFMVHTTSEPIAASDGTERLRHLEW